MKKGSALLIVLGMLAFIVASAVAFSAYMRYSRMPSSYLRRTSSSRLLAKAALAEAIDVIDNSIGNDAWPGQSGRQQVKSYKRITDDDEGADVVDYWQDRCFIGSNQLVSVEATVATLCTEALAYIPPPIVNEVRYYSRRSAAGMWHTLGFDSGRFAFTAVDVSDYFDINSVRANPSDVDGNLIYGRNSSDRGRITLSHCFENDSHTGYVYAPEDWDEFMENYLADGKMPLVSVADMALAMNKQGLPAKMNPFVNYIRNGANFVQSESGPDAELLRNMTFVTDGWFAPTNRASNAIDLSRAKDQPFYGHEKGRTVQELIGQLNSRFRQWLDQKDSPLFNQGEIVQLYDYLDEDSVPMSLALPTVERTPMITGVTLGGEVQLVLEKGGEETKTSADGNTQYVSTPYTLKLTGSLDANFGAVFPFKYGRAAAETFKTEAVVTLALVPSCTPEKDGLLRCENARAPGIVTLENGSWNVDQSWKTLAYDGNKPSVARCRKAGTDISPKQKILKQEDAVCDDVQVQFGSLDDVVFASDLPANDYYNQQKCSFRVCKKKVKQMQNGVETWVDDTTFVDPTPIADRVGFLPAAKDLSDVVDVASVVDGTTFAPTIQVWVRVYKGSDTVDLVPACWKDDKSPNEILRDDARGTLHYPMLRFHGAAESGVKVENDELKLVGGGGMEFTPKAYLIDDPRFNFAPENFEALATMEGPFDTIWLAKTSARSRDGDIFMTTSDAGYLQSVYELANISQICPDGDGFGVVDGGGYNGRAGSVPARAAMWRTYSQYGTESSGDEFDYLDVINGSRGFRVSPYAQSRGIILSALANTPLDWWAASTNDTVNTEVHGSQSKATKYSFSEMSGAQVQMRHDDLANIADRMTGSFRAPNATADWRSLFDGLGWNSRTGDDEASSLCGQKLDTNVKLHSVDRKFLHGFWKECFANRQQLFLIFVRAEPMMMGGGGLGQTPPQLGARAVALVWRDPTKTKNDVSGNGSSGGPRPHRSRILFYRQFD